MNKEFKNEVFTVLEQKPEEVPFESSQEVADSPINQGVVDKEIGETQTDLHKKGNPWKGGHRETIPPNQNPAMEDVKHTPQFELDDAPEQSTDYNPEQNTEEKQEVFQLPKETAKQAADTILGMTNNVLAIGGGYLIKIKKHQEFYDFDDVIELIDEQNEKNIKRIQLDKEDKALLKPLIILLLQKRVKKLTPEQQLTGAILSILLKKAQMVLEIRAENEILLDKMLDIIRKEKASTTSNDNSPQETTDSETYDVYEDTIYEDIEEEQSESVPVEEASNYSDASLYESVVETVDANTV